jgi:hypothetical protein
MREKSKRESVGEKKREWEEIMRVRESSGMCICASLVAIG